MIHESHYDKFVEKLVKAYSTVNIGSPLNPETLCGPLHSPLSMQVYETTLAKIKEEGAKILCGGKKKGDKGFFVEPTIVEVDKNSKIIQ